MTRSTCGLITVASLGWLAACCGLCCCFFTRRWATRRAERAVT